MLFITILTGSLPLDPDLIQLNSVYSLLYKTHLKGLNIYAERTNEKITSCSKIKKLKYFSHFDHFLAFNVVPLF